MSDLKAKYDTSLALEKDLYTQARARELLIVYTATHLAHYTFKDNPAFDSIRELLAERDALQAQYYAQAKETTAAFDAYMAPHDAKAAEILGAAYVR